MPFKERYRKDSVKYKGESSSWYYRNREKVLERQRLDRIENPEKYRDANRRSWKKRMSTPEKAKYEKQRRRAHQLTLPGRYYTYMNGAKNRGIDWALDEYQFGYFWGKPCHYCAEPIDTIGLDRKDNSIGYHTDNVVPCCTRCNLMKKTMNYHEFIGHCTKISFNVC